MFYIPFPRLLELCWLLFSFKLYDSILGLVSHVNAQITHDPRTLDDVFLKEENEGKSLENNTTIERRKPVNFITHIYTYFPDL